MFLQLLSVKLKLYHFIALSAQICYLYKHRSNQIRDCMHRIKIKKNHRGPFQLPAAILDSDLNFPFLCKFKKMTTTGFESYGPT